jgi:signal transduction histidine kinase
MSISNALTLLSRQYHKKGIQIDLNLKKNLGLVKGNPYKFEQVVINLLTNAKDAILEKQEKTGEFSKKIHIETYDENNSIILKVIDNGIGLEKKEKINVFKPFYTTKKLGSGTGLGLSIVYGIIKEMKGIITFDSEIQKGTEIEVRIPEDTGDSNLTSEEKH